MKVGIYIYYKIIYKDDELPGDLLCSKCKIKWNGSPNKCKKIIFFNYKSILLKLS